MSTSGVIGDPGCIHSMRLMYIHENDGEQVASKCPKCKGYDFRKLVCNECGHTSTDTGTCKCFAEPWYNPHHLLVRGSRGKAVAITEDNGEDTITSEEQSECS